MAALKTISALLACALILTGCASGKQPQSAEPSESEDTPVTVIAPADTVLPTATAAPTATPEQTADPTATPTPRPTAAASTPTPTPTVRPVPTSVPYSYYTPTPAPEKPFVSKHPVSVTVAEGGSCTFEAGYINAIWAVWHFVSPDGKTDLAYDQLGNRFPGMEVLYGMYSKMELRKIPLAANGWRVYCRYTNSAGSSDSNWATLTVTQATPGGFELAGSYMDSVSRRASMEITGTRSLYNVTIHWGNSAFDSVEWTFSGFFDTTGVMRFSNAVKSSVVYDSAGNATRTTIYSNGSGTLTFSLADGSITWDDGHGTTGHFIAGSVPAPTATPAPTTAPTTAPVVNEWTETPDLSAAAINAGVPFSPPIPEALPAGVSLDTYRSKTGVIEARYSGGTLIIRKSNTLSGSSLSGDYNSYSQTWDHTMKGVTVHCRGNGTTVNEATFSAGEFSYSISFRPGQEGAGLTLDQINSLLNGMY